MDMQDSWMRKKADEFCISLTEKTLRNHDALKTTFMAQRVLEPQNCSVQMEALTVHVYKDAISER